MIVDWDSASGGSENETEFEPETSSGEETADTDSDEGLEEDDGGEETEGGESYTPDLTYRFYRNDGQMAEWAKPFITDKASEENFRALFAKSSAFDLLRDKQRNDELTWQQKDQTTTSLQNEVKEAATIMDELHYRRDNDLGSFFDYCHIPVDKVIDFVEGHIQFLKKPEAEQAQISQLKARADQARIYERENSVFKEQQTSAQQQEAVDSHLESFYELCDHPDVSQFEESYDSVVGNEGAFRTAVIAHGESEFYRTGKTLSPLEAMRGVYKQYNPFIAANSDQSQFSESEYEDDGLNESGDDRRPVIPNMGGGASRANTKRSFQSIDDLKAYHKELVARER